ncbi:MAG: tripartite tricarboxylate transporter substrate-binding protein, partial [Lautropia sp.]
ATPDGHTILMHSSLLAISPSLYRSLPFNPTKDLVPLSQIAATEMVVLVRGESPIRTLADLAAMGKAHPGKMNFASAGNGTIVHLAGELLKRRTGTDMVHVPYKGSAPGLIALMGDEVQVSVDVVPVALPHVRSGRLRALAVASDTRSAALPQVPTTAEAGFPGFEIASWNGFFVPAGTPPEVMRKLHEAIAHAMAQPQVKDRMAEMGAVPMATSQRQFQAFFDAEVSRFAQIVQEANVTAE